MESFILIPMLSMDYIDFSQVTVKIFCLDFDFSGLEIAFRDLP